MLSPQETQMMKKHPKSKKPKPKFGQPKQAPKTGSSSWDNYVRFMMNLPKNNSSEQSNSER